MDAGKHVSQTASKLRQLRIEAGFKSSREFAKALGIPPATYSRYEQSPERIPMRKAMELACRLGCSIDMIVGHECEIASPLREPMMEGYQSLSLTNQARVCEYIDYLLWGQNASKEDGC